MDAPLCGTQVTGNKIMNLLAASPQVDINGHRITRVNTNILSDQGHMSVVFGVNLTWSSFDKSDKLPESVIVKATGSDSSRYFFDMTHKEKMEQMKELESLFNVECAVYGLAELSDKVPMPVCYGFIPSNDTDLGIIVLEDLTSKGVLLPKTIVFGEGLNSVQLDNMLDVLTNFHAWSVNTTIDWRTPLPSVKENANCTYMEQMRESLPETRKDYPQVLENLDITKVNKLLTRTNFAEIFQSDPRIKYNLPSVLVHGDIQPLNILFKLNDQKKSGNEICALLDWAISHPGCGIEDLSSLLSCVSVKMRRDSEDKILLRYVELFNKKVHNKENAISIVDVKRAYEEMFSFNGVSYGCGIVAMVSIADGMTSWTDEERENLKQGFIKRIVANYQDSIKMLGW